MSKSIKKITLASMLLTINVLVLYIGNFSLMILPVVKISLSFIPIVISAILLGPVYALAIGGLGDIISFLLNPPGVYFFGWTLNSLLIGLIYGVFLNKNYTFIKLIVAKIIILVIINIILGSLWLNIQYGFPLFETIISRSIAKIIIFPFELFASFYIIKSLKKVKINGL